MLIICLTILILVGWFGVSLKTPYFDISTPKKPDAAQVRAVDSIQHAAPIPTAKSSGDDSRETPTKSAASKAVSSGSSSKESVAHSSRGTPSVLVVPLGTTLHDSLTSLRGRKFARHRVQGGELIVFRQEAFGLNWAVSELFRNDSAVSATLTKPIFAEGREGTAAWQSDVLQPVSVFCFGEGYQSLRDTLDTSMQLVSGRLDDEMSANLDVSQFQPCPNGKNCTMEWVTRYGNWTYHAPGMRDVTLSIGKSEYTQYEFADGGYDRTVLRRQRCEMRLIFSGQDAPTRVPLSLLP